ncbi:efflux RND transporter periplasmic adaptor subunit [Salibacterium salarium]|uniref:Efflux RND transporter periplasmic adaptor subunit n=1 Tax=Salibacterium salarium TaxID=284579 RepID=A0A428N478_9BACI|nr:efflux RND transporter periplasmic adaptor subunit [Salibacterium salarium]RSL33077.1 efflux RND transporter periplasmic adaptor subunit [Salibacterium salarium]
MKVREVGIFKGIGIFAVFFIIAACQSAGVSSNDEDETVPVETATVERGNLEGTQTFSATTEALSEVSLMPEVNAEIEQILVEEGDTVEQGEVLARLDDTELQNTLEQERAAYQSAKSNVSVAEAGQRGAQAGAEQARIALENADHSIAQAEEQYEQAQTDLEQAKENQGDNVESAERALETAERNLETAKRERDRSENMLESGLISEQEMEEAESAVSDAEDSVADAEDSLKEAEQTYNINQLESQVASARSALEEARDSKKDLRASIDSSEASVDEASGGIEDAKAGLEQARVAVEQAEENVEDAVVRAPSSGKVLNIFSDPGEYYSQQEELITLGEMTSLNATANVTSEQLSLFNEGEEMEVHFPSVEQTMTGNITYVASSANDNGMFPVEVQVDNSDDTLRSGIYGELLINETYVDNSLLVPTEAIVDMDGESSVFIIEEGEAALVSIEVIREESDLSAVNAEMEEGSSIAVRGQYFLEDGTKVEDVTKTEEEDSEQNAETDNNEEGSNDSTSLAPASIPYSTTERLSAHAEGGGGEDL